MGDTERSSKCLGNRVEVSPYLGTIRAYERMNDFCLHVYEFITPNLIFLGRYH